MLTINFLFVLLFVIRKKDLILWCPLLPYWYSYKASCARPGYAIICNFWHPGTYAQSWASECQNVKNYKWGLNPVRHRMLYSCTQMATVGVKGLTVGLIFYSDQNMNWILNQCWRAKSVVDDSINIVKESFDNMLTPYYALVISIWGWSAH